MSFGKRPPSARAPTATNAAPPPPPPMAGDPHGRRKVFPDEVWNGPSGAMLRELGLSPNDENNLVPNAASINARLQEGKSRLETRTAQAQANAQSALRDAQLRPFFLIPDPIWNSDAGTFLMTSLDLFPYDDWNVVFLGGDQRTAVVMDIALHPDGNVPTFVEIALAFMADAHAYMKRAQAEAELTTDYAAFQDAREDAQLRVKSLAMSFARALIQAWETHKGDGAAYVTEAEGTVLAASRARSKAPVIEEDEPNPIVEEIQDELGTQARNGVAHLTRALFDAFAKKD